MCYPLYPGIPKSLTPIRVRIFFFFLPNHLTNMPSLAYFMPNYFKWLYFHSAQLVTEGKKLNKTSIDWLGICLCWFAEENQQNMGCKSQGHLHLLSMKYPFVIVHSLQNMIFRLTMPFLKLVGLGVIADPESSNSWWQNWKIHSITKSPACTHIHDKISFKCSVPVWGQCKVNVHHNDFLEKWCYFHKIFLL